MKVDTGVGPFESEVSNEKVLNVRLMDKRASPVVHEAESPLIRWRVNYKGALPA